MKGGTSNARSDIPPTVGSDRMKRLRLRLLLPVGVGVLLTAALAVSATRETPPVQLPPPTKLRLGINLSGPAYWSTEHAFANLAKYASRWRTQRIGQPFTWDDPLPAMTPEGYPTKVPEGAYLETFLIGTAHREHLSDELVVLYDGKGKLAYDMGARLKERAPGRDVIEDLGSERGFVVAQLVETDPADPVRNLRLYEPAVAASPTTFRKAFLDRWAKASVLRFMDWMATNDSPVRTWPQRPRPREFMQTERGVALEYLIELANAQKAAPWFCMPHLADDDYVRRFAQQVKRELDPSLPVYVEYSNEVWNAQFEQSRHASRMGQQLKLSGDEFEGQLRYYSQRTSDVLRIWEEVFADQKARVLGVYATQAANPWTSTVVLEWKDAKRHADVLAIAPYFGNSLGDPEREREVAAWSLDRLFEALLREVEGENRKMIEAQAALAHQHGVKLVAYEGGQHLVGHGGAENNEKLERLFQAANRDPRMKGLYRTHLKNWTAAGGELFVAFNSMASWSKWGSWGLLEHESQSRSAGPKWQALQEALQQ